MVFGTVKYKIIGDGYSKIYNFIMKNNIPCSEMSEQKGVLYVNIGVGHRKNFEQAVISNNCEYSVMEKKGLFFKLQKLFRRKGLVLGIIFMMAAIFYLSNIIFKIEILSDDPKIKKEIISVLKENGVKSGSFIPSINCTQLERELKKKVSGISWAGISKMDSTFVIDIVKKIDKPEYRKFRMPSNLVSKYNAVIDKVDLLDGQLVKTVGSGVVRGDIIVSGTVVTEKVYYKDGKEMKDISTRYARSTGKIYGTFKQKKTFFQPFTDTKQIISNETVEKKSLKIFDLYIPFYMQEDGVKYIEESSVSNFSFLGIELPIGLRNSKLTEYHNETYTYTKNEARDLANSKVSKYETNFLKKYKIEKAKRTEKVTKKGVKVTVEYTLYGDICEEVEFFVNK